MYLAYYALPKTGLDKYLKSVAAHYPWTTNMVNGLKHCSNLRGGTFTMFIGH